MLLLVFFLSHVDDSHDKVLKLAPLKRLPSKVNLDLPIEWPAVFMFTGTPRYYLRGLAVLGHMFVSAEPAHALAPVHMFGRVYVDVRTYVGTDHICGNGPFEQGGWT